MDKKRNSNFIFFCTYFASCFAGVLKGPYTGMFLLDRGLTGGEIGIISLAEGLITPFACLFMSFVMSTIRQKKILYVLLSLGCCIAVGFFWFSKGVFAFALWSVLMVICSNSHFNFTDRILVSRLHENPEDYSRYRLGGSAGYGLGALISGTVLSAFHYPGLFGGYAAGMLLCAIFGIFTPMGGHENVAGADGTGAENGSARKSESAADSMSAEKTALAGPEEKPKKPEMKFNFRDLPVNAHFLIIYGTIFAFGLAEGMCGKFMAVELTAVTGEAGLAGKCIALAMIGEISIFLIFPTISKKLPQNVWLAVSFFTSALRMLSFVTADVMPMPLFVLCQIVGGVTFSIWGTILPAKIEREYPDNVAYVAQMLRAICFSLGQSLSVAALGLFYERSLLSEGYIFFMIFSALCSITFLISGLRGDARSAETR